jgi:hypothetical protein
VENIKQCVVRTYAQGWTITTERLDARLDDGWIVMMATPFVRDGRTEYIEYILQKPGDRHD